MFNQKLNLMSAKVNSLNLGRLRNNEYNQFIIEVVKIVDAGSLSRAAVPGMTDNIASLTNMIKAELEELDKAIISLNKSELTDPIADSDRYRDMAYRGFTLQVEAYSNSTDAEKREAARRIQVLINNYGDFRRKPYNDQTSIVDNFIQDLGSKHTANIELINAGGWVEELTNTNNAFKKLMDERYDEKVDQLSAVVYELRSKINLLYRQLISMLEVGNMLNGGAMYTDIINQINERVSYYKTTLSTRKGRADAKKDEEGEE